VYTVRGTFAEKIVENRNEEFFGKASGIRAVIFDYGEVLCQRAPLEEFAPMARVLRITPEQLVERYSENRLPYDRGDVTAAEYWTGFARESGVTLDAAQIEELDSHDFSLWWNLDPELMAWVDRLRANGIRAGVLSNMPIGLANQMRAKAPWLHRFDAYTLSAEIRATKPDAAIYQYSLEQLGLSAPEALFLDDRQVNVEGARAIGMEALLFKTTAQLRDDLEGWGFPVLPEIAQDSVTLIRKSIKKS
jgi:putative hydrolase of the HAD superfamily